MTRADTELLERAVAGDAAALRLLLERCGPQARKVIRGKIGKQWRAMLDEDDVMQVTYLEAFLHIEQLIARDTATFAAWLSRIAENILRDAIKELERKKRPPPARRVHAPEGDDSHVTLLATLDQTSSTPSRHAARDEAVGILDGLIRKLPADYRTVVQLCDLEGRSMAGVAESMERSVGAVHMLRVRAHHRLRELMGSESKFFSDKA